MNTAVHSPDPAQLARGRELGDRIHAVMADVSAWIDEATPDNARRFEDAKLYGERVLAQLQSAKVDLATMALSMAERSQ